MKFKQFWQQYHHDFAKLITTHIAISVFSILCSSVFMLELKMADSTKNFLLGIVVLFTFAFYYYLIRVQLWQRGAKDKLSADGGRITLSPLTGLWLGLLASVPSFLFNILYLIGYYYQDYAGFQKFHSAFALIELLWDSPAIGLRLLTDSPYAYLTSSVLPVLFAALSYYLGTREFSLFPKKKH